MPAISLGNEFRKAATAMLESKLQDSKKTRLRFLLRWDEGAWPHELAREFEITRKTVWQWQTRMLRLMKDDMLSAYQEFLDVRAPGRPSKRSEQLMAHLAKIPPREMAGSTTLARRLKIPERTIRRFLASRRRKATS